METYLSKSNKAEIDEVMKLRHDLTKAGDTIIEHLGDEFKMSIMNPAKRVICVPPMNKEFTKTRCVVGRGNYSEADYAMTVLNIPHYMYKNGKIFKTTRIEKIPGKDSWQEYGYVYYEEEGQFLNPLRQNISL
jgi:hypothetical protein